MPKSGKSRITQHVRTTILRDGAALTDGQLLESFVRQGNDAALAALVHRHGPMVWGVCHRLLHRHHDAEDAFQATFLVLVRKAATIRDREKVANWLYGVAHQTAVRARKDTARRGTREKQVMDMPEPAGREPNPWNDLQPLLDQELSRLPDSYCSVIVLCDLMGKTRQQVARQLGCPEGTVAGRLVRARAMLAKRLARNGLAVSPGVLAEALTQNARPACPPPSLLSATINAGQLVAAGQMGAGLISPRVAALTEGVLKAMLLSKIPMKIGALFLLAMLGVGMIFSQASSPDAEPKQAVQAGEAPKKAVQSAVAAAEIAGILRTNEALFDEKFVDKEVAVSGPVLRICREGDAYSLYLGVGMPFLARFSLDNRKELAALGQGQQVTLRGVVKVVRLNGDKQEIHLHLARLVKDRGK